MKKFKQIFPVKKPIIGMIHLLPLPGYKDHPGMGLVISHALKDLKALEKGGIDGVMVENEYDHPHQVTVGPEIISAMTKVVSEAVKKASVPVGLEVLLNDPKASLAIAKITGAKYIRTDYFVDKMAREEYGGEMFTDPRGLMEYRKRIGAENVVVLTDLQVKYATLMEKGKTISQSTSQAIEAGSGAVIITGNRSGQPPKISDLKEAKLTGENFPVIIGSGFSFKNAENLLQWADGAIVGESVKIGRNVNLRKVKQLMKVVGKVR